MGRLRRLPASYGRRYIIVLGYIDCWNVGSFQEPSDRVNAIYILWRLRPGRHQEEQRCRAGRARAGL